jgi:predicted ATPase
MINDDKVTLIFEGTDASGKSTLIKELQKLFPELELVDRWLISDEVYAKKFNRSNWEGKPIDDYLKYWAQWHKRNRNVYIVLCEANVMDLLNRCKQKDDIIVQNKDSFNAVRELNKDKSDFNLVTKYICYKYDFKLLILNTTEESISKCLKRIQSFIRG